MSKNRVFRLYFVFLQKKYDFKRERYDIAI